MFKNYKTAIKLYVSGKNNSILLFSTCRRKFCSLDHHQTIFKLYRVHIKFNGNSLDIECKVNAIAYQLFRRRYEEIYTLLLQRICMRSN